MGSADPIFQPGPVMAALRERGVRVMVVGALVARIRGFADIRTRDLDLTPDLEPNNLQRLAETLHALGATVRIENHAPGPVRLPADGGLLSRAPILNLHLPDLGDVDVIHQVANETAERGPLTFLTLEPRASMEPLPGVSFEVLTMSERDWLDAKRTPPVREKDRLHLDAYRQSRG